MISDQRTEKYLHDEFVLFCKKKSPKEVFFAKCTYDKHLEEKQ